MSEKKRLGRERLQRIVSLCESVEEQGVNPFVVDVDDIIEVVREYFHEWELPEELCLDAEVINRLSSVIKLQSDWLKHRSTSLYTDPFLLEEKIRRLGKDRMVDLFVQAWNPIVELEQISPGSLALAVEYWRNLLPLSERWQKTLPLKMEIGAVTREELIKQRILSEQTFSEMLEVYWKELKDRAGEEGKIRYWDLIGADTYAETVKRAYLASVLLTYGYATLEIHPLEEKIFIRPHKKPESLLGKKHVMSVPISIGVEDWRKWKESRG